jgi:hypothetical protein
MCLVDQLFDPVSRRFNFDDGRMSIAGHAHHRSDLLNVLWVIGYLEPVIRYNRKYNLDCNHIGTVQYRVLSTYVACIRRSSGSSALRTQLIHRVRSSLAAFRLFELLTKHGAPLARFRGYVRI